MLVVLGLVVAAVGATVAVLSYRAAGTPEAVVRAYFAALADGRAGDALAAGTVPAGGRALVSDDVLAATLATAPIDEVVVSRADVHGAAATVPVRYRVGGAQPVEVTDVVPVNRDAAGDWRLTRSAVAVQLTVAQATNWAAVPAARPFAVPDGTQLVFPGVVPVVYRAASLEVTPDTRTVRFADASSAHEIRAEISPAGATRVADAVRSALTACAAGGVRVDPFCPQPAPGTADGVALRPVPQSFVGSLTGSAPTLTYDVAPGGGGTVAVTGSVTVSGRWQVLDYDNRAQDRSGTATMTFGATVAVATPGTVTWDRG